jgi:hypothetical protein
MSEQKVIDRYRFGYFERRDVYKGCTQAIYNRDKTPSLCYSTALFVLFFVTLASIIIFMLGSMELMLAFLVPFVFSCFVSRILFKG